MGMTLQALQLTLWLTGSCMHAFLRRSHAESIMLLTGSVMPSSPYLRACHDVVKQETPHTHSILPQATSDVSTPDCPGCAELRLPRTNRECACPHATALGLLIPGNSTHVAAASDMDTNFTSAPKAQPKRPLEVFPNAITAPSLVSKKPCEDPLQTRLQ